MMANKRYNLTTPIKLRDGGTFWHTVGAAWYDQEKDQISMEFNSLPLPNGEGKARVLGSPPKEEDGKARTWPQRREATAAPAAAAKGKRKSLKEDLDDEV